MVQDPKPENLSQQPSGRDDDSRFAPPSVRPVFDEQQEDDTDLVEDPVNELAQAELAGAELERSEREHREREHRELQQHSVTYSEFAQTPPDLSEHPINRNQHAPTAVTVGQAANPVPAQRSMPARTIVADERTDGITIIALYHFGLGLLTLLGAFVMAIPTLITGIAGSLADPDLFWVTAILGVATFFFMGLTLMYFLIGVGLWRMRQWARVSAIALAIISLPSGLGTIPGALTLWYLMKERVSSLFR